MIAVKLNETTSEEQLFFRVGQLADNYCLAQFHRGGTHKTAYIAGARMMYDLLRLKITQK